MELEALAEQVIGACIEVHRYLGPGLLESAYEECLCQEPTIRGLPFKRQVPLPAAYKSVQLDAGYRLDLVVDGRILLELKACDVVPRVARAQVISYLRLAGLTLGYLINFHACRLAEGIQRIVLNHPD